MTDRRRNLFILLLVAGIALASALVIAAKPTRLGLDLKGGIELVYQAKPTRQQPTITPDAINRAIEIMRERVDSLGVAEPEIQRSGSDQISVGLPSVQNVDRAVAQVGKVAQLFFYDWEANVIGPNGKPDPTNLQVTGGQSAGAAQLGLTEYNAVTRAEKRPPDLKTKGSTGVQYYLVNDKTKKVLAGPIEPSSKDEPRAKTVANLWADQPGHKQPPGSRVAKINIGTIIVEAEQPDGASKDAPKTYYVLRDNPALSGNEIKDPEQSFDNSTGGNGQPIVTFKFTGKGQKEWAQVTKELAHRGQEQFLPPKSLQDSRQHFAAVLDGKLITVPYIDFQQNPDGIDGKQGAEISGSFTIQSAQDLAKFLKIGALPVRLDRISESQVSATLGKEALHQGLIAGLIGLALVALVLLAFYRVLGLIACGALLLYALYFFALVKLIPVTLTLPGIAGLILTIGVAADANIVIFERVKEEIRAGTSPQRAIVAGYKKGLSAIIDANVVTIMTAFILFILATAGVKGFAFMLGIGTLVSLFTAVLATQAVLGAMSRSSRMLAHPAAFGVGKQRRRWTFDFMGASKWFFSMSGVILLIGALAIGGKGLNFGIDFESGTRMTVGLTQQVNETQVRDVLSSVNVTDAKVQRIEEKGLGPNAFQISSEELGPGGVKAAEDALTKQYGIAPNHFHFTSIGPTFGKTVANSAIIAIIASLLVISAYITLRFEWRYAVPVLIALMHDILIVSGVYALLGEEVTSSTVAALLTILGYSLYDTIIVFDRIRENVPRMPRAAFSQIVNRSMSEVLTRSLVTTGSTLLPVAALLFFGGETLRDFAFALLIGVASGAYSSIFIAGPVLTHWKEREPLYRRRRARVAEDNGGIVPAYAAAGSPHAAPDVAADPRRTRRQRRGLSSDVPEEISQEEFDALVEDLHVPTPSGRERAPDASVEDVDKASPRPSSTSSTGAGRRTPSGTSAKPKRSKPKKPRNRKHGRA